MNVHLCTDVKGPRRDIIAAIRWAARNERNTVAKALEELADSLKTAPKVAPGVLAQVSVEEESGARINLQGDGAAALLRRGIDEVRRYATPGTRVVRVSLVLHLVEEPVATDAPAPTEAEVSRG